MMAVMWQPLGNQEGTGMKMKARMLRMPEKMIVDLVSDDNFGFFVSPRNCFSFLFM